jgi:hypothetical protein
MSFCVISLFLCFVDRLIILKCCLKELSFPGGFEADTGADLMKLVSIVRCQSVQTKDNISGAKRKYTEQEEDEEEDGARGVSVEARYRPFRVGIGRPLYGSATGADTGASANASANANARDASAGKSTDQFSSGGGGGRSGSRGSAAYRESSFRTVIHSRERGNEIPAGNVSTTTSATVFPSQRCRSMNSYCSMEEFQHEAEEGRIDSSGIAYSFVEDDLVPTDDVFTLSVDDETLQDAILRGIPASLLVAQSLSEYNNNSSSSNSNSNRNSTVNSTINNNSSSGNAGPAIGDAGTCYAAAAAAAATPSAATPITTTTAATSTHTTTATHTTTPTTENARLADADVERDVARGGGSSSGGSSSSSSRCGAKQYQPPPLVFDFNSAVRDVLCALHESCEGGETLSVVIQLEVEEQKYASSSASNGNRNRNRNRNSGVHLRLKGII